jgi:outer membrane protein
LAALDNLEFSEAEQESIGRQLEQTKQRFEVGLVAITDVHEAQARFDLATANSIAAENQLDNARESLRTLTGQYHTNLAVLSDKTPFVARPDPDSIEAWTEIALENNFELLASQHAVEQARENVKLQRADYYPSVGLSASYTRNEGDDVLTNSGFVSGDSDSTSVSVNLSMNLYEGGRTRAQTRQAAFDLTQSQEFYEETLRAVQRRVRSGYLGVISGVSQVSALKQAVVSNESALQAAEAGFEVGTRTTVDVLNARSILFSAINDHAQSRYDYILAWLGLLQAAGTLEEEDLQRINQWLVAPAQ